METDVAHRPIRVQEFYFLVLTGWMWKLSVYCLDFRVIKTFLCHYTIRFEILQLILVCILRRVSNRGWEFRA